MTTECGVHVNNAWKPGAETERAVWFLSRVMVTLVLWKTIISPLMSVLGMLCFAMRTGTLENKNMPINHENKTLVVA